MHLLSLLSLILLAEFGEHEPDSPDASDSVSSNSDAFGFPDSYLHPLINRQEVRSRISNISYITNATLRLIIFRGPTKAHA